MQSSDTDQPSTSHEIMTEAMGSDQTKERHAEDEGIIAQIQSSKSCVR